MSGRCVAVYLKLSHKGRCAYSPPLSGALVQTVLLNRPGVSGGRSELGALRQPGFLRSGCLSGRRRFVEERRARVTGTAPGSSSNAANDLVAPRELFCEPRGVDSPTTSAIDTLRNYGAMSRNELEVIARSPELERAWKAEISGDSKTARAEFEAASRSSCEAVAALAQVAVVNYSTASAGQVAATFKQLAEHFGASPDDLEKLEQRERSGLTDPLQIHDRQVLALGEMRGRVNPMPCRTA
jgi:hypothetical protein